MKLNQIVTSTFRKIAKVAESQRSSLKERVICKIESLHYSLYGSNEDKKWCVHVVKS